MIYSGSVGNNKPLILKRKSKIHLIKAVRELEKRGFECIQPITRGFHEARGFNADSDSIKNSFNNGVQYFYYVKMQKVGGSS